jgi:hypothetical protein
MKRLMLLGAAVCAFAAMPALPASAMPFGLPAEAVAQTDGDIVLVRHRNRGHHYGWKHSRRHHYGWSRHKSYRG